MRPPNPRTALQRLAPPHIGLALLLGLGPAVLLGGCGSDEPTPLAPSARVERGLIERLVVATGTIEPEKQVEVRSRIPGIVEKIHVEAGDLVEDGQPLVEIDRELNEVATEEARARLREARVELRYAKSALGRVSKLHEGGTIADQGHDDAEARYQRALASVASAKANVDRLEVQLRYATVTAPMAGKILDVDVEEGSAVASVASVTGGTRLLTLASDEQLHLDGLVDENEIVRVEVGQPARIQTEAFGDRIFEGRVREISPIGQRQQNVTYFEVEVLVTDDEAHLLRPMMSGDADIIAEVVDDALLVPETALRYEGNEVYVELRPEQDGEAPERRVVELGIVDSDRVQVRSGLREGEAVLLR